MSCMIMSAKPLASLADFITSLLNAGYNYFGMEAPSNLYRALDNCADKWGIYSERAVYDALHDLNVRAYNGRYKRENADEGSYPAYAPNTAHRPRECVEHHEKVMPWHFLIEKRLAFLTYQCCEDATYDTPLYKALVELEHQLDTFIVQNSNAWQSLEWGE